MIDTKKPETPWYDQYRVVKDFPDSKEFVDGYNQALKDFDILFGTAKRPGDEDYRCGTIHGSNQIHNVCEFWKLVWKNE